MHNRLRRLTTPLTQQPLREHQQPRPRRHGLLDLAQLRPLAKELEATVRYRSISVFRILDLPGLLSRAPP